MVQLGTQRSHFELIPHVLLPLQIAQLVELSLKHRRASFVIGLSPIELVLITRTGTQTAASCDLADVDWRGRADVDDEIPNCHRKGPWTKCGSFGVAKGHEHIFSQTYFAAAAATAGGDGLTETTQRAIDCLRLPQEEPAGPGFGRRALGTSKVDHRQDADCASHPGLALFFPRAGPQSTQT